MAIAFDNAATAGATGVSSVQWTHTATGSDLIMIAAMANFATRSISSWAAGNVALTQQAWVLNAAADGAAMWTLTAPAAGALTVSATSVGGLTDDWAFISLTYTGVQQSGSHGQAATATGAASTVHNFSMSTTVDSVAVAFIGGQSITSTTVTTPAGQNARAFAIGGSTTGRVWVYAGDKVATGSTTSQSWSTALSLASFKVGLALTATAASAVTFIPSLAMLGVGQ